MQSQVASTPWQFLALPDEQLEQANTVRLNLAVARGIPGLENLDVEKYVHMVDEWTELFSRELRGMERSFKATPWKWKSDIRFFRVGMLQGFLGHIIGIRYIEEQKHADAVYYTDPGQLFLHGLIDTKQGTCGNMATLHVAMCRRMGWPVSLACARAHLLSRFDDGHVIHNIEATSTHPGSFNSEEDSYYIEKFKLPRRAIECGSDLRKLTARQMLALFITSRGRHYRDTGRMQDAEVDYALSRALFPDHRWTYVDAMATTIRRGAKLFDRGEVGHPDSLFEDFGPRPAFNPFVPLQAPANDMNAFRHRDLHIVSVPLASQTAFNGKELPQ